MNVVEAVRHCLSLISVEQHLPGRVCLNLCGEPEKRQQAEKVGFCLGRALGEIEGIVHVDANQQARSVTVDYDNRIIPDRAWSDLLENRATPEAEGLRRCLQERCRQLLSKG